MTSQIGCLELGNLNLQKLTSFIRWISCRGCILTIAAMDMLLQMQYESTQTTFMNFDAAFGNENVRNDVGV